IIPNTASPTVNYKIEFNGSVIEQGTGSVSGKHFSKGTTKVTYSYTDLTTQSCSFNVVVADHEAPVINPPVGIILSTLPGQCQATLTLAQLGTPVTSDNCSGVTVTNPTMPANNIFAKGTTTLTWTATDGAGNTSTASQTVTVEDHEAPHLTNVSLSTYVLSPPNHKMMDVTVNYQTSDNCGATTLVTVTSDEAQSGLSNADLSPDWEIVDAHHVRLRAERDPRGDGRVYTIHITAT